MALPNASEQPGRSYLYLRESPPLSPVGLTVYESIQRAWSFLGVAIQAGKMPGNGIQVDDSAIVALWQARSHGSYYAVLPELPIKAQQETGICRWEQIELAEGKRLVRVFKNVQGVGIFGDGQLERADIYTLERQVINQAEKEIWVGQEIRPDGSLAHPHYPYGGIPMWPVLDVVESLGLPVSRRRRLSSRRVRPLA